MIRKSAFVFLLLSLVASLALAQMHGRIGQPPAQMPGPAMVSVAADGTVITGTGETLVAYTSAGTKAWTYALPANTFAHRVDFVANLVVFATTPATVQRPMMAPPSTELVALNLSNGTVAWKKSFEGATMHIAPAANQFYVVVVGTNGARTLVAVSLSGATLWSVAL